MRQSITSDPTAISGTSADQQYTIQNKSLNVLHLEVATAPPSDAGGAFDIRPGEWIVVSRDATQEIYIWSGPGNGGIAWDEVA